MSTSTKAQANVPVTTVFFPWLEVSKSLRLKSTKEISKFVLAPSFLQPWTDFRDCLPLRPDIRRCFKLPEGKAFFISFPTMIYHEMENMHLSKYDRPSESDRRSWGNFDFLACLVYQCIRDLARPDHAFAGIFDRKALRIETGRNKAARREAGRKEASTCILGVIKLACNLIISYTSPSPDDIVKLIEETMPALRPEFSPIREVRTKAQLTKMGVDELRRMVLGGDRRGIDEKEWLVNILLKKDPRLETWATGEEAAGGIKRPIEVEDDEPTKKARTESAQANDLGEG